MMHQYRFTRFISALLISTTLALSACSVNPVSGKKEFSLISKEQEVAMGAQGHQEIIKKTPPYNNRRLQAYVNSIGQQLASKSHRNNIRYTFTVLDDPAVNAFALPGGYIYITTGIMAYLNSEGELAGVLGHEIGHVTARHGVQQASVGTVASVAIDLVNKKWGGGNILNQIGSAALSGYGRQHELQADRLGAEYLARVGYSPSNMIDVISVLKSQEQFAGRSSSYHGVFATHPSNDQRLQEVVGAAKRISSAGSRPANHDGYLREINGLKFRISKGRYGRVVVGNVKTAGITFETLAQQSAVDARRLRLLNGKYPNGQPKVGTLVKIIK